MTHQTQCRVCRHQMVRQGDAMKLLGRSNSDIARAMSAGGEAVSADSVGRHFLRGHADPSLKGTPSPQAAPLSAGDIEDLVLAGDAGDSLANLRADLAVLMGMDTSKMSPSATLALFAERRRINETIARIVPPPIPRQPDPPSLEEHLARVQAALGSDYEARWLVIQSWRTYKGMDPLPEEHKEAQIAYWKGTDEETTRMAAKQRGTR
jgi:hypothetical protein